MISSERESVEFESLARTIHRLDVTFEAQSSILMTTTINSRDGFRHS